MGVIRLVLQKTSLGAGADRYKTTLANGKFADVYLQQSISRKDNKPIKMFNLTEAEARDA